MAARAVVRAAAAAALRQAPIALWRRLAPKSALGVCYHLVADSAPPHMRHYPAPSPAAFAADLAYLRRKFGFISYEALAERRGAAAPTRDNTVILTFDDGFAECATVIAPMLRQAGIPAVFFIITDLIDNATLFRESEAALCISAIARLSAGQVDDILRELDFAAHLPKAPRPRWFEQSRTPLAIAELEQADPRLRPLLHWLLTLGASDAALLRRLSARLGLDPQDYLRTARPYLTTPQLRQLHADGFTIGAHSRSHRLLQALPPDEAAAEIVESCRIVHAITGQPSTPFAFPYSGAGLDRDWLAELRRRHPCIGLYFDTDGVREDVSFVVQRVFGERFGPDRTLDARFRRAWSRPSAWRQGG
jgi:peptidoglycan/xylan/chitin deacetylase (PgdA/CDA1 family)